MIIFKFLAFLESFGQTEDKKNKDIVNPEDLNNNLWMLYLQASSIEEMSNMYLK